MPAQRPDVIVFLCPNGHRLNGPASLEGKAGQCPHCGAKFRVPSRHDTEEHEEATEPAAPDSTGRGSSPSHERRNAEVPSERPAEVAVEAVAEVEPEPEAEPEVAPDVAFDFAGSPNGSPDYGAGAQPPVAGSPALFDVVAQLWALREPGAVLELHLEGGAILVPEWFSVQFSGPGLGLFAHRDADGTYTINALSWDQVRRVALRHLTQLPGSAFE